MNRWKLYDNNDNNDNNGNDNEVKQMDNNRNIIGKTFASWSGMEATYIETIEVPEGFRIICESMPNTAHDHIVYGRRTDGEYIGVGQPYPLPAEAICEINEYCRVVGLKMLITGGSTWNSDCLRILFQRDEDNTERFNIAVNCSLWLWRAHCGC